MDTMYAVILAGGKGERFWPLSTSQHPKQMLALVGDKPMLAMTADYVRKVIPPERILIITSAELVEAARQAAPAVPAENVIGEPVGRDTAAACALASALVKARCPEAAFCILTADHIIGNLPDFEATLREGLSYALRNEVLITIGIPPTFPSTGFGYIEAGSPLGAPGGIELLHANRFVEKPDAGTAAQYVAAGNYYWNSGMFMWSVRTFQAALARYCSSLHALAQAAEQAALTGDVAACLAAEYAALDKISIDYAVMEKADNIVMARGAFTWDDVGSWPALAHHVVPDADGNVVLGDCQAVDATGNVVVSRNHLTALIGVSDLVVVHAENVTLVCPRDRAQEVKAMVRKLRAAGTYERVL